MVELVLTGAFLAVVVIAVSSSGSKQKAGADGFERGYSKALDDVDREFSDLLFDDMRIIEETKATEGDFEYHDLARTAQRTRRNLHCYQVTIQRIFDREVRYCSPRFDEARNRKLISKCVEILGRARELKEEGDGLDGEN